jgi:hypothetical protein
VVNPLTLTDPFEDHGFFVMPIGRNNHGHRPADRFLGRVAKKPLGPSVPTGDHPVEDLWKGFRRPTILRSLRSAARRDRAIGFRHLRPQNGALLQRPLTRPSRLHFDHVSGTWIFQVARGKPGGQLMHTLRAKTGRNY